MKKFFKDLIILILLIFQIILVGCNKQSPNINEFIQESHLENIVSESISDHASSNDNIKAIFESHKIVGKELKKDILSVYVIGFVMGVYDNNKDFGGEYPAHIKIQKVENNYKVVDFRTVMASMEIYNIMPKKYAKEILDYDTSSLYQIVKKQTDDWRKTNQTN